MSGRIQPENYVRLAKRALREPILQQALANLMPRFGRNTAQMYQGLSEGADLRLEAHRIRMETIENLDVVLDRLTEKLEENGTKVLFAETGEQAVAHCLEIARRHDVKRVVKGKSMVTEEVGLNAALDAAGIEVSETDLGEYIVQLADEAPSHIIAPAIHKTRREIGRLFEQKLKIPYTEDPPTLTRAARKALREKFLRADMGISGCNLACAETGHIAVVSNEGNIRMSSTLPRVHVVFMGMERVVARLADYQVFFKLLPIGAAAQKMATYVSYIAGPKKEAQADGPDAVYVIVLDNGRSRILADKELREILCCIRCAACLNVCPVYRKIGGHAYGYAYSGPIGAVITPLLVGINRAKHLCTGESLCGACKDACPVDIDLPKLLLALRAKLADGDPGWDVKRNSRLEKIAYAAWSRMIRSPALYAFFLRTAAAAQHVLPRKGKMIESIPGPLSGWTQSRDLPMLAKQSFRGRWKESLRK